MCRPTGYWTTTMTKWIYTGERPSNGAKALAEQPGFRRLRTTKFVKSPDVLINWGCSQIDIPVGIFGSVLNSPDKVALAANKLQTFAAWSKAGVEQVVSSTTDKAIAQGWLDTSHCVVVRNKLTGHSGDGILIIEPGQELPAAPLYTKYVFKDKEFRAHVVNGVVIDTQQKIRDPKRDVTSWKVRSHDNGFMFVRLNVPDMPARDALAVQAVASLGLDFGAVDLMTCKNGKLFLLEVNTAPGLEGQTITNYSEAFNGGDTSAS